MHYTEISEKFVADFLELTGQAKNICITAHISPDDDSIASLLAAYRLLSGKYRDKKIEIIYTAEPTNRYNSFQNFEKIQFVPDLADHLDEFDLLLCLDGSQHHRFTQKPAKIKNFTGKTVCLDHHSSPIDKFDLSLVDSRISSTTEIIYLAFHKSLEVDKPLAEIFLLGILGDTGNFTYLKPDQAGTLTTAKKLIESGEIEIAELQARYRTISTRVLKIIQEFIKNTEYHQAKNWPDFQTSFVDRDFIYSQELTDKEIKEAGAHYIAYYIRAIKGYSWGFIIRPEASGGCDVSFRSLPGSVNVRELAEQMGVGGGHDRAAGGSFKDKGKILDAEECLDKILDWMKENKPITS